MGQLRAQERLTGWEQSGFLSLTDPWPLNFLSKHTELTSGHL
jgi:hypothetical protein